MKITVSQKYLLFLLLGIVIGWGATLLWQNVAEYSLTNTSDVVCPDGNAPDKNGCCAGEVFTDMGDLGFNCCPENGDSCFPPIK